MNQRNYAPNGIYSKADYLKIKDPTTKLNKATENLGNR